MSGWEDVLSRAGRAAVGGLRGGAGLALSIFWTDGERNTRAGPAALLCSSLPLLAVGPGGGRGGGLRGGFAAPFTGTAGLVEFTGGRWRLGVDRCWGSAGEVPFG